MRLEHWWDNWHLQELLESYLPDFVLAFAFFTSIIYAVLGKRLEHQRSAITMSATMGLALAFGLVWWEQTNGFSIKNLGPIAIGFAILLLAFVMNQSIRQVGGSWAGAGITLGASIIIAQLTGMHVPIDAQIIQTVIVASLIFGLLALMLHNQARYPRTRFTKPNLPGIRHTMADLYRNRHLSKKLDHGLKKVRREAKTLDEHPEKAGNVQAQINRMLPAQGRLTQRMAELRAMAHRIRNGHIARLEETRHVFARLPTSAKKKAAAGLSARYSKIVGLDTRMETLDKEVAVNEKHIRDLTREAQLYSARQEHQKLYATIKAAEKLQHHNSKLFKTIDSIERQLSAVAKKVAKEVKQIEK